MLGEKLDKRWILGLWIALLVSVYFSLWYHDITIKTGLDMLMVFFMNNSWAWLLLLLVYIVRPITLVPSSVVTSLAALLLGWQWGLLVAFIGEAMGMVIGRFLGRYFFKNSKVANQLSGFVKTHKTSDFVVILLARLAFFSDDVVSYGSGMLLVPFRLFLVASVIGNTPALIWYIRWGEEARKLIDGGGLHIYQGIVVLGAGLLTLVAWILYQRRHKNRKFKDTHLTDKKDLID